MTGSQGQDAGEVNLDELAGLFLRRTWRQDASDWLAQHVERALAAERERIATAIEEWAGEAEWQWRSAKFSHNKGTSHTETKLHPVGAWLRDRAAIARGNPHTEESP